MSVLDPEPTAPPAPTFQWIAFIGGIVASLIAGGMLNILSGLLGMATNNKLAAFAVAAIPGIGFAVLGWSLRRKSPGFGIGLIFGGSVIALIGGICGSSMVGTSFH